MKLSIALTVAALVSSAALAQQEQQTQASPSAQRPPPATAPAGPAVDVGAIFDKLDTNHDGKLSPDEAAAHPTVMSHFKSADTDGDGMISKEEFLAAFKPQQ